MNEPNKMVTVTQPFLPELDEFIPYLEKIWKNKWLTNNGEFHQQLEKELALFLGVPYISLFTNGTLALVTALQALEITGEVITTPFSFVATTHALWWNGIKPVFADIEPGSCNLDPSKIEASITPQTKAILPVHVYGNPCEVEKIREIADKHHLKVIYDAAHAFGVKYKGASILNYGDMSILSFHSTKIYHTFEGGAIVCHDAKTKQQIDFLKNFGFKDEITVVAPGINAKMSEVQAAMGLLQLRFFEENRKKREQIVSVYNQQLKGIQGIQPMQYSNEVQHNYGYFPVFIDEMTAGISRDMVYSMLKDAGFFTRRYFYPLISSFSPYRELPSAALANLPVANQVAGQVLCLPIFTDLAISEVELVCEALRKIVKS